MKQSPASKKALKAYEIPLKGLQQKSKEIQFLIDENFFQHFENAPLKDGKIAVLLTVKKRINLYELDFNFNGTLRIECDRCMEWFDFDHQFQTTVLLKKYNIRSLTAEDQHVSDNDDSDIIYIAPEASTYNVAQLLYEFTILGLPIQRVHPSDAHGTPLCDPKVLEILQNTQKDDISSQEQTEEDTIDPRWAALQQFKNKNK